MPRGSLTATALRKDQAIELEGELPPPPSQDLVSMLIDGRGCAPERGRREGRGEGAGVLRPRSVRACAIVAQRGSAGGVWAAPAALLCSPYQQPHQQPVSSPHPPNFSVLGPPWLALAFWACCPCGPSCDDTKIARRP